MDLRDHYAFEELVNEAERLVLTELGRQLEERGDSACMTEECVLDMAAYAMNRVSPMYRVNLMGRIYADSLMIEHSDEVVDAVSGSDRSNFRRRIGAVHLAGAR